MSKCRTFRFFAVLTILLLICCAGAATAESAEPFRLPLMQLHHVGLGSANCHLLIAGNTVILIDGGTDTDTFQKPDRMLAYVASSGIDHIDAHFVTHYHNDHAMQIDDFSRDYGRDSTVVYGPSAELNYRFLPLPNGTYRQLLLGDELDVGPFHVLCAGPRTVDAEGRTNHDSLNLLFTYGQIRILFTGDYAGGQLMEEPIASRTADVDILIFPHHGLEPFTVGPLTLRHLNPALVLVPGASYGGVYNYFDQNYMAPLIRCSGNGNLVVLSDGVSWQLYENVAPGAFSAMTGAEDTYPAPESIPTEEPPEESTP